MSRSQRFISGTDFSPLVDGGLEVSLFQPYVAFLESIEALTEMLDALVPHVEGLDGNFLDNLAKQAEKAPSREKLTLEQYARVRQGVAELIGVMMGGAVPDLGEGTTPFFGEKLKRGDASFLPLLEEDPVAINVVSGVLNEMLRATSRQKRPIVLKSILTAAYSEFESLIASLVRAFYQMFPESINAHNKEFSLAEVRAMNSAEDAFDELVGRRVDGVMRGGIEEWMQWFEKHLKIDWHMLTLDWIDFIEVTQRRHAVIHSRSLASRAYLGKVAERHQKAVGELLRVDADYVRHALAHFRVIGSLISLRSAVKMNQKSAPLAARYCLEATYSRMRENDWSVVAQLAGHALETISMQEATRQSLQANYWLSQKRLGRFEAVTSSVEAWDTSALAIEYALVKACLLDQLDHAVAIAEAAHAADLLPPLALAEWPILEEIRGRDEIQALISTQATATATNDVPPESVPPKPAATSGAPDVECERPE